MYTLQYKYYFRQESFAKQLLFCENSQRNKEELFEKSADNKRPIMIFVSIIKRAVFYVFFFFGAN